MAITISPKILGQEATGIFTYSYLHEPLELFIEESDPLMVKMYMDIYVIHTDTGSIKEILTKYVDYDIAEGVGITIDLMKVLRQYLENNIYKAGTLQDIVNDYGASVSPYKFDVYIYTEDAEGGFGSLGFVSKLPIVGARRFKDFVATVDQNSPSNEFEKYGLDLNTYQERWKDADSIELFFKDPTLTDATPTVSKYTANEDGKVACGMVHWKSRYGGWMFWGFDLKTETSKIRYSGNLQTGMFESTQDINGNPYVGADYTEIGESYSIKLKALNLTSDELKAVDGIQFSPAIYFQEVGSDRIELMRLTSASVPQDSMAQGGDFSITLSNISTVTQKTI